MTYYFGADKQDHTSQLTSHDYIYKTGCSWVIISSSWFGGNTDRSHDHAVVEFDGSHCNAHPGNLTGWLGTWAAGDSYITDDTMYVYGYPGKNLDCVGYDCYWPSIWGHGNSNSGVV